MAGLGKAPLKDDGNRRGVSLRVSIDSQRLLRCTATKRA